MRIAVLITFAVCGMTFCALEADAPEGETTLTKAAMESQVGYIVPEDYAAGHKADILVSIPGVVKLNGFWTPTEQDVTVADRVLRDLIHDAVKDPTRLFPDLVPEPTANAAAKSDANDQLEHEQHELTAVSDHYDTYDRQYLGIVLDGKKLIFCNYSIGTKVDPSIDYIFIHKVFVGDGTVHFLQCRFDPEAKTCANVSMIGSWPPSLK